MQAPPFVPATHALPSFECIQFQAELHAQDHLIHSEAYFISQEILFEASLVFNCVSRHNNLIGFQCEVALFRRVLQAAGAHGAECLEVLKKNILHTSNSLPSCFLCLLLFFFLHEPQWCASIHVSFPCSRSRWATPCFVRGNSEKVDRRHLARHFGSGVVQIDHPARADSQTNSRVRSSWRCARCRAAAPAARARPSPS